MFTGNKNWMGKIHAYVSYEGKVSRSPWVQLLAPQPGTAPVKQAFTTTWKILSSPSAEICSAPVPKVLFLSWEGGTVLLLLQKH